MMKNLRIIGLLMFSLCLWACQREMVAKPMEASKTLNGTWKITKAFRNGTDLTSRFDFSAFKIVFKDSTYTLENPVPFVVAADGSFHLDDPKYPFKIFLNERGGENKTLDMEFPINNGVRNIIISFSPGCTANTYQYTLQQVN